jgi:hypothetical protein
MELYPHTHTPTCPEGVHTGNCVLDVHVYLTAVCAVGVSAIFCDIGRILCFGLSAPGLILLYCATVLASGDKANIYKWSIE